MKHCLDHCQSPEFKFRFVFFPLQMLRFSVLCGQIWQKFWGSYDPGSRPGLVSSPIIIWHMFTKFLLIWSTESWETQHLKAKKHKLKFEFRTLIIADISIGVRKCGTNEHCKSSFLHCDSNLKRCRRKARFDYYSSNFCRRNGQVCQEMEGHCDFDDECEGSLKCGYRNCRHSGWPSTANCCYYRSKK